MAQTRAEISKNIYNQLLQETSRGNRLNSVYVPAPVMMQALEILGPQATTVELQAYILAQIYAGNPVGEVGE